MTVTSDLAVAGRMVQTQPGFQGGAARLALSDPPCWPGRLPQSAPRGRWVRRSRMTASCCGPRRCGERSRSRPHARPDHISAGSAWPRASRGRSPVRCQAPATAHIDLMLRPRHSLDVVRRAELVPLEQKPLTARAPRSPRRRRDARSSRCLAWVEKEPHATADSSCSSAPFSPRRSEHDPRLVLDAFMLRSLAVAGYAPALHECARCGASPSRPAPPTPGCSRPARDRLGSLDPARRRPRPPRQPGPGSPPPATQPVPRPSAVAEPALSAFAIPAGGMVCASCRPPGAASPAAPTVALMLALLQGDWEGADHSERGTG